MMFECTPYLQLAFLFYISSNSKYLLLGVVVVVDLVLVLVSLLVLVVVVPFYLFLILYFILNFEEKENNSNVWSFYFIPQSSVPFHLHWAMEATHSKSWLHNLHCQIKSNFLLPLSILLCNSFLLLCVCLRV